MTKPTLRIVIGTAGSGNTTIAQRLARQHGAAYLNKDAMSARFVEAALLAAGYDPGDRESNAFYGGRGVPSSTTRSSTSPGPTSTWAGPVVIDAPFGPPVPIRFHLHRHGQRGALADWRHVDVEVVRVRVSPTTLQQRLRERGLGRRRLKLAHWDRFLGGDRARRHAPGRCGRLSEFPTGS